jgi:hypothetical protein
MKNSLFLLLVLLITVGSYSQVPQGISYQAVAFNTSGNPVVNGNVGVKISILDNSIQGTVVYSETHLKLTNAQGLFNLNIGQGTPSTGPFSSINWETNSKFLKVEVDPAGGTNYTNIGTNQLMSVPYTFYSKESENAKYLLDEYISIWSDNTIVNLVPNKKYFINANNITLILPSFPQNPQNFEKDNIEIYVMQHDNNPRNITINRGNSLFPGILNVNNDFLGFGINPPTSFTGHFQTGYNKIINIGDFWMCAGFRVP